MADARGINGRHGFIPYPGIAECGDDFDTWATKIERAQRAQSSVLAPDNVRFAHEDAAREAKIGARDMAHAFNAPRALDDLAGGLLGQGVAQMTRAPGKMFSRETVCAIIRGQIAITYDSHLKDLLHIFENLE